MYQIFNKQILGKDIRRLDVKAPAIAAAARPGLFVMVAPFEDSEWIPLSIVEADASRGTIALIVRETDPTTKALSSMSIYEKIAVIIGPLGHPVEVKKYGDVLCAATGDGIARILPVCRALKAAGNRVIGIIGARTKSRLTLEAQMRLSCHKIFMATEDGSYERRGTVTELAKEMFDQQKFALVYAAGSVELLEAITQLTKPKNISTRIQVSPLMCCGMGVCGSCRIVVGGKPVLACVDGPTFNAHKVDFAVLKSRMQPEGAPSNVALGTAPYFFNRLQK